MRSWKLKGYFEISLALRGSFLSSDGFTLVLVLNTQLKNTQY